MEEILDLRGLKCPLPALLARKAMARLAPGTRLNVLADDPMAAVDIPYMCHGEGHGVVSVSAHPGYRAFLLQVRAGSPPPTPKPCPEP